MDTILKKVNVIMMLGGGGGLIKGHNANFSMNFEPPLGLELESR